MKIEHITQGGTAQIRDSADINLNTLYRLDDFRHETQVVSNEHLPFDVKITATPEGAAFDIVKDGETAVLNMCCFGKEQREEIIRLATDFTRQISFLPDTIRVPELDTFLISFIVNPFALTLNEMMIAGEVELYIYYKLFLSRIV